MRHAAIALALAAVFAACSDSSTDSPMETRVSPELERESGYDLGYRDGFNDAYRSAIADAASCVQGERIECSRVSCITPFFFRNQFEFSPPGVIPTPTNEPWSCAGFAEVRPGCERSHPDLFGCTPSPTP